LLEQSFTAHMALLMATSTFTLQRRCWNLNSVTYTISIPFSLTTRLTMFRISKNSQSLWVEL